MNISLPLLRKRETLAVKPVAPIIAPSIRGKAHKFDRAHRWLKLSCSLVDTRRWTTCRERGGSERELAYGEDTGVGLSRLLSAPVCMLYREQQVSEVCRATSRHTAGYLWPPRPRIHKISLRPSSTFTVLAISNAELWRCSWCQLDRSTGRAAAAFVLRRGCGGTRGVILIHTTWVLLYTTKMYI